MRVLRVSGLVVALFAAACGGGTATSEGVAIEMNSAADSFKGATENTVEVTVTEGGAPVTDANVTVEFVMPAMPSMNMAEMRNSFPLAHAGDGRYRGTGSVSMSGGWDATVVATRNGT